MLHANTDTCVSLCTSEGTERYGIEIQDQQPVLINTKTWRDDWVFRNITSFGELNLESFKLDSLQNFVESGTEIAVSGSLPYA